MSNYPLIFYSSVIYTLIYCYFAIFPASSLLPLPRKHITRYAIGLFSHLPSMFDQIPSFSFCFQDNFLEDGKFPTKIPYLFVFITAITFDKMQYLLHSLNAQSYLNLKLDDFRDMSVFIFDYVVITSDTHIVKPLKIC